MAYVLKINHKPIIYIFNFELARFIDIKKFFEIYSDRSGDFYSGVMSHDPFNKGNDTKIVCFFSMHCICSTINTVNG